MDYKEQINYIKSNFKTPKTFDDYINYVIFFCPVSILGIGLMMIYNFIKFHSGLPIFILGLSLTTSGMAVAFFTAQRLSENLQFERINTSYTIELEDVVDKIKTFFKTSNIHIDRKYNIVTAITNSSAFSWGERITIIKIDNKSILINSRPSSSSQPITIIKDKQNIQKLKRLFF